MNTFFSRVRNFLNSASARPVALLISVIVIALLAFQAGILVGYHEAQFSFKSGDRYFQAFHGGGPRMMFMGDFAPSHGAAGKIVKVELPSIVIDDHGIEKIIKIEPETLIRSGTDTAASTSLKTGDTVVVIGEPNTDNDIEAALIRIFPPGFMPPDFNQRASTTPQ